MSDLNLIKPKSVQNIINKFCYTIGMIPTSYKVSLSFEEQIIAIGHYLEETVIPALNNNAEAVAELQSLFIQLKDYVENYFDNLDVQEEINNKIDQMAESGELLEIFSDYFNKKPYYFNTVADMKAYNLQAGDMAITLGYYAVNDGGGANYVIKNSEPTEYFEILNNNNYAELIVYDYVSPENFGAKGDGITDDTQAFILAVSKKVPVRGNINKRYYIKNLELENCRISDCYFSGINKIDDGIDIKSFVIIENCKFYNFKKAVKSTHTTVSSVLKNVIFGYNLYGYYADFSNDISANDLDIINCYFSKNGIDADNMSSEPTPGYGYGIYLCNNFDGVNIVHNVFEYNTFTGIYLKLTSTSYKVGAIIEQNYFEGNKDSSIYLDGKVNVEHFIKIDGNYFSNISTNVFNTKYINIKYIFKSVYDIKDINNITMFVPNISNVAGVTENNHKITISEGNTQYLELLTVHNKSNYVRLVANATLNSDFIIKDTSATNNLATITNGTKEYIFRVYNSYYLSRVLSSGEKIEILEYDTI